MVFFTADSHFAHRNILRLQENRGKIWTSVDDMNDALVRNWNSLVGHDDEVYHLGDFSLGSKRRTRDAAFALKGRIYLIKGNHEKAALKYCPERFEWIKADHQFVVDKQKVWLYHYPIGSWNGMHRGQWHFHGHSHFKYPDTHPARLDVGIDNPECNFHPFTWEELKKIMGKRVEKITPTLTDHHV